MLEVNLKKKKIMNYLRPIEEMPLTGIHRHVCHTFHFIFLDKVMKLIGGGSVINRAYPVYLKIVIDVA